jgi:hypothetical protein
MKSSIFALEVAARIDQAPHVLPAIKSAITEPPSAVTLHGKWELYKRTTDALVANLHALERGCWDYFDDHERAERDFKHWSSSMTTGEGARREPSGRPEPYRGEMRYFTVTMAFLLVQGTPTDRAMRQLCDIPQAKLWQRDAFARILSGMSVINFASVKADVIYLIPRDDDWGLTAADLAHERFNYLRTIV